MVKDLTLWQPVIEIGFNKPMAKQSIPGALHISPELPFELSWPDNSNVEITLLEPLQFNATYEFTIDQSATDELGIPLLRDYTWSYRLKDIVKSKSGPAANAPDNPLTVSFNYEMDASQSLDGLALEPAIEGEWAWDEAHTALHFLPHTHYKPDATYTLSFNDPLITEDGTELPLLDPIEFTTSPAIQWAGPEPGNVSPENAISIQFDRPMDPETTEAAFSVTPDMAGSFAWEETTLYFYPDSGYLGEDQQYEVTLAPTALAADGSEILDIPYSWTFTTTFFPEIASFGNGPNAQVLDANGRRAIHYVITRSLSRTLTFELYSLSLEQFLDRYAAGFSNIDQGNTISTEATELAYSWDVEPERLPDDYRNLRELLIPNDVPPGLYLLNLNAGWLDDQLILVLTNNTITVKQAEGQIMAWVTDINGRPVPGIEVGVYARDGHLLASDTADSRGIFRGTMPAFEEDAPPSVEPLIIVAQDGRDITASGLTTEWQLYAGSSYNWSQPNTQEYAAYIYTDRPIYRPGHTVFFKAIIRTDQDALLAVPPAGTPATVSIRDARNNAVQTMEMTTNDFGSLDGTFQLAEGAMLGSYQIVVTLDNTVRRQRFKVEDYRKPDYEVSISTDAARYLAGDTITIVITAAYYFGEPVANAEISLVRFDLNGDYYSSEPQTIIGRTNADGIFTTTLPAETIFPNSPSSREGYPLSTNWGYEATVDDGSHQSVSSFKAIQVFDRTEYITFSTGSYLQQPGTPFNIVANISNIFGDPVGSRQLSVQLRRWSQENADYSTIVQSQTLITEEDGQGILPFTVEESGYYQLHVSGTDQTGETISYQTWVHVFSSQYNGWSGRQQNLKITADEESYAPGDTARLLIESTFSGPALLTMQRGTIQREMLVELTAPVTLVEVPIETTHVPNIYVIVHAWEEEDTTLQPSTYYSVPDSRLKTAYINLSVPATDKNLTVTITPNREVYAPGSEATFTIEVTNYRGEPVSAELSLAMVDEAIFALSSELSGSLYNAFYYRRDNRVGTFHSLTLSRYLPIEEGGWGGGGEGGGGDGYSPGSPRSDFQDTAAWFPTLYTDADGRVQVTITLPDNLTSWRLTAKAATADTQIGQTTLNVLTQQPIIIQPLLPRTLTAGDTVGLSVMVHNYTESTQAIQVSVREADDSLLTFDTP